MAAQADGTGTQRGHDDVGVVDSARSCWELGPADLNQGLSDIVLNSVFSFARYTPRVVDVGIVHPLLLRLARPRLKANGRLDAGEMRDGAVHSKHDFESSHGYAEVGSAMQRLFARYVPGDSVLLIGCDI